MIKPLFSVPFYQTQIVPNETEQQALDLLLTNMFDQMPTNEWAMESGKSTGSNTLKLHYFPETRWLFEAIQPHVYKFWEALDYRHNAQIDPQASWANLHLKNDRTGEHSHSGGSEQSHISAVYYFKKPADSGNIEFVDPLEYVNRMVPIHHYSEVDVYREVPAAQYDLILFPSWLKHRTQVNKTDHERVAISINCVGHWKYE